MNIRIFNDDPQPLTLSIVSGGSDWTVTPGELHLSQGESGSFNVEGPVPEGTPVTLIFMSDRDDIPPFYSITVRDFSEESDSGINTAVTNNGRIFFYTPGCTVCEEFYSELLPELEKTGLLEEYPDKRNIYIGENYELMRQLLQECQVSAEAFPLLIWDGHVFTGENELFRQFPRFLEIGGQSSAASASEGISGVVQPSSRFFWLTLLFAGLLDGINPCAFTTLIFLISYLRLLGRKGRDVIKVGGSFTVSVFLSYFLIGLGMFRTLQVAQSFNGISLVLRWMMILMLLLLSGLSFFDYLQIRKGRATEAVLQLGGETKKRIHRIVRKSTRSSWLVLSSFGAGFLISLYELGCTGQIYLPMAVYMVKNNPGISTFVPLVLYNLGFISPLALVFLLFYRGTDSEAFSVFFKKHLGRIKLATAVFFCLLAVFLFFS